MSVTRRMNALSLLALVATQASAVPPSNVCPTSKFAWGENLGWMNWKDANGGVSGVNVYPNRLAGFIWAENAGWVNVGDGGSGGAQYLNTTGLNFGVNIGAGGACDGYAWGENVGWINFNTTPTLGVEGARYDSAAHRFRGYAWGENVGWINLDASTPGQFVGAVIGDLNGDGRCDFFDLNDVLTGFGHTGPSFPGDTDGNGTVDFFDLNTVLTFFGQNC